LTEKKSGIKPSYIWIAVLVLILAGLGVKLFAPGVIGSLTSEEAPPPVVRNSPIDGSVHQVVTWLRHNSVDAESLVFYEWSDVVRTSEGRYSVSAEYGARSSNGAFRVERMVFILDAEGNVVEVVE